MNIAEKLQEQAIIALELANRVMDERVSLSHALSAILSCQATILCYYARVEDQHQTVIDAAASEFRDFVTEGVAQEASAGGGGV